MTNLQHFLLLTNVYTDVNRVNCVQRKGQERLASIYPNNGLTPNIAVMLCGKGKMMYSLV